MKLQVIVKGEGIILDQEVSFVSTKGSIGEIGILNGHAPLITPINEDAPISYKTGEETAKEELNLKNAILEVSTEDNTTAVKIIADAKA